MKVVVIVILLFVLLAITPAIAYNWVVNPENGHHYILVNATAWSDAENQAVTIGGHLATIRNQSENDFLYQWLLTETTADRAWIGLYQLQNSVEPNGGWMWSSGEPVSYTNWNPGEPNNGTNEDWGEFWIRTYVYWEQPAHWNDTWPIHSGIPVGVIEVVPEPSGLLVLVGGLVVFGRIIKGKK